MILDRSCTYLLGQNPFQPGTSLALYDGHLLCEFFPQEEKMRLADKRTGYALCRARLAQRRLVVLRTLRYIDSERNNLETIHATRIPPALRKRRALLDKVHGWYTAELKRIDSVLLHLNDLSVGQQAQSQHKSLSAWA